MVNIKVIMAVLLMAGLCFSAPFSAISISDASGGLGNLVSANIFAQTTNTTITSCSISTTNSIEENNQYFYREYGTTAINQTVVFEKTDAYRMKLSCTDNESNTASTGLISAKGNDVMPTWMPWGFLLASVLLLIFAFRSDNMMIGIFSSLAFLLFVKSSEGAYLTLIESLVPVYLWIKVIYAICLTIFIANLILKQAKIGASSNE